jgi:ABC-type amino acid transport system permease subunit
MIGFGIPVAGVPWLGGWSQYGAAARSLGLSQAKTMRFVVLPQAVRRPDRHHRGP